MESTNGNEGINKLASILQGRMHETGKKPQAIDFGEIQGDMSLLTNQFRQPIPQGDYMVCRQLTLGPKDDKLTTTPQEKDGEHKNHTAGEDYGKHLHDVVIPEKMRSIKPGDRVLVAWVGDDACVIDIILPGTAV